MAFLNRQVLVLYDVGGPDLWHERLVLQHLEREEYKVATPGRDVYAEELSLLNPDLRGIRVKPDPHNLPAGFNPAEVYPLPAFNAVQVLALHNGALQALGSWPGCSWSRGGSCRLACQLCGGNRVLGSR